MSTGLPRSPTAGAGVPRAVAATGAHARRAPTTQFPVWRRTGGDGGAACMVRLDRKGGAGDVRVPRSWRRGLILDARSVVGMAIVQGHRGDRWDTTGFGRGIF